MTQLQRRKFLAGTAEAAAALALGAQLSPAQAQGQTRQKVFRTAYLVAETGFDPQVFNDLYSNNIMANIFESPLRWAYLAQPAKLVPMTAAEMPEVSADFKTFTVRIRPGIYFDDHPAFGGKKRELTAEDYVYSIKRIFDPRWKSQKLFLYEPLGMLGLSELRKKALQPGGRFDYDTPAEGLRTLDRYTFQVRLAQPAPRFLFNLALPSNVGAVAREVVQAYGDSIGEHPVGTGPFRLAQWVRASRMVLERNPNYREEFFNEEAPPGDAHAQQVVQQMQGWRLPVLDRVEVSIIEESQPRWLAFVGGELDMLSSVPLDFADIAIPGGQLAPNLRKKGITLDRYFPADLALTYFNMNDPVVGGMTPEKVALRRAISLAYNEAEEITSVRRGQAIIAQGVVPPSTFSYDPNFKTEMGDYDPARAQALLDMYGYLDRNGDGWRELPDGRPLVLRLGTQPDQLSRQLNEQWKKNMTAVGLNITFDIAKWPEQLKQARAGVLQMWGYGWNGGDPDPDSFVGFGYSRNDGESNLARFHLARYDALYQQQKVLPDNAERAALLREMSELLTVYMPYKMHCHRIGTAVYQPWLRGAKYNPLVTDFWRYLDVDARAQPAV